MPTRLWSVVVDAADPPALARFWSAAIGWPVLHESPDETFLALSDRPPIFLVFVPVPVPKSTKNRIHLDLASESSEHQARTVQRLVELGAKAADVGQRDVAWIVLADPEGNEFCVLEPRESHGYSGPVGAIVMDAVDPGGVARFWSAATGWPVVRTEAWGTVLHEESGKGPYLDIVGCADSKVGKNHVHLDVRPFEGDDHAAEVERLIALGARRVDIGQGNVPWVVLADPEDNEFCVLTPR